MRATGIVVLLCVGSVACAQVWGFHEDAPETDGGDAAERDDGSYFACNPSKATFPCGGPGNTVSAVRDICILYADGELAGIALLPQACNCVSSCACVAAMLGSNLCVGGREGIDAGMEVSCTVVDNNMTITCTGNGPYGPG